MGAKQLSAVQARPGELIQPGTSVNAQPYTVKIEVMRPHCNDRAPSGQPNLPRGAQAYRREVVRGEQPLEPGRERGPVVPAVP